MNMWDFLALFVIGALLLASLKYLAVGFGLLIMGYLFKKKR